MSCKKGSNQGKANRRRFLQAAVMGTTSAALAPGMLRADNILASRSSTELLPSEVEVVTGMLIDMGDSWLELQEQDQMQRIALSDNTSFWKGGESVLNALSLGDNVMVRTATLADPALRVWTNLTRVQGKVIGSQGDEYILQTNNYRTSQNEIVIRTLHETRLNEGITGIPVDKRRPIEEGDSIDAIGEFTPDGLKATLVYHHSKSFSPSNVSTQQEPEEQVVTDSDTGITSIIYSGTATWFDCATGAGRCGCNASSSTECAWPAMDSGCDCCSFDCCNCSKGCRGQVYLSCGNLVTVTDRSWLNCSSATSITATIADCGPCQQGNCGGCSPVVCGRRCPDCRGHITPVVDLTKPTFTRFYDPTLRGCFSCDAIV